MGLLSKLQSRWPIGFGSGEVGRGMVIISTTISFVDDKWTSVLEMRRYCWKHIIAAFRVGIGGPTGRAQPKREVFYH